MGLGTSLNVAVDLTEQLQLKSITAYRDIRWTGVRDADNTPLTILHTIYDVQGDQLSEELQLVLFRQRGDVPDERERQRVRQITDAQHPARGDRLEWR